MHIEDWDDRFLSEFDPEDYVDNLKRAKIQCAMIYLQSHVGLCNFPTKVAATHKAFVGNDKMKRLLSLCKQNDIAVVGYYSLINNNWAKPTEILLANTAVGTDLSAQTPPITVILLSSKSRKCTSFSLWTAFFTICRFGLFVVIAPLVASVGPRKSERPSPTGSYMLPSVTNMLKNYKNGWQIFASS